MDNYNGHSLTDEASNLLARMNMEIRYFPKNATHLVQPADSFVISKIKDAWTRRWEQKKIDMIRDECWQNNVRGDGGWSGALSNPGKNFYLQLAADAVNDVNKQRTKTKDWTYAHKAMVRCGLACGDGGEWKLEQLSYELQTIISTHWNHFEGEVVGPTNPDDMGENETEAVV
jgi:DDE superfamily endonuclease